MPLTRRVQVFISKEGSEILDLLADFHGGQTRAIEFALRAAVQVLAAPREPLVTTDGTVLVERHEADPFWHEIWLSLCITKVDGKKATKPNAKPLDRPNVQPIPKPGGKKHG